MKRAVAGAVLASLCIAGPAWSQGAIDEAAQAAIERTRTTQATYSVFTWNRLAPPGAEVTEEWAAEFHDGNLHRVETPRDRVIANCATQAATHFSLVTGERVSDPAIARTACGVQANSRVLAASYDGQTAERFGLVEHITIRDPDYVRTYAISSSGAIVGATIEQDDGTVVLESRAVAIRPTVADDIFSPESLATSAVPEEFRRSPAKVDWLAGG